jgi:hypoxia up-regulated 1
MKNHKIVRRLMREVPKYKEILSSNKEIQIRLLEIADDVNLVFTLQREEFENRIENILLKAKPAFDSILAKHPIDTIADIELLGGGLRVPKVKEFISELLGKKTLSTHLNPDEAMAFGSAYIAANFSSSYQVQKVYLYQSVPYNIYLNITQTGGCDSEDTEECFKKHMVLYDENTNYLGQKKTINIDNHIENMDVVIYKIDSEGVEKQVTIL